MKKLLVIIAAMSLALSLTACGGSPAPSSSAPAPSASSSAPAPSSSAPAATPTPAPTPSSTAPAAPGAPDEETTYTLDYATIASWVDSGFIGNDHTGSPVVMAIDAANETAIIIFGDNSDMTAASFVGTISYGDTTATIVDEANGTSLSFGVSQVSDDTIALDMGDIGTATIKAATKDEVLKTIKNAIDNYTHVA